MWEKDRPGVGGRSPSGCAVGRGAANPHGRGRAKIGHRWDGGPALLPRSPRQSPRTRPCAPRHPQPGSSPTAGTAPRSHPQHRSSHARHPPLPHTRHPLAHALTEHPPFSHPHPTRPHAHTRLPAPTPRPPAPHSPTPLTCSPLRRRMLGSSIPPRRAAASRCSRSARCSRCAAQRPRHGAARHGTGVAGSGAGSAVVPSSPDGPAQ